MIKLGKAGILECPKHGEYEADVPDSPCPTCEDSEQEIIPIVSSDGKDRAVATITERRCTKTCRGTVVRAVWGNGQVTYPCLRGCSWDDAYQAYVINPAGRRAKTKLKGSLARVTVPDED